MREPATPAVGGQAERRDRGDDCSLFPKARAICIAALQALVCAHATRAQESDQRDRLQRLVAMLGEDTPAERNMAAREIGRMGVAAKDAVPVLLAAIEDMKYASALGAALGRIGPVALPEIREALRSGSPKVRTECLRALEVMGGATRDVVPLICTHIHDGDRGVRVKAIQALAKIAEDKETISALAALATDEDEGIRDVVARALGELGPRAEVATPGLIAALRHKKASQYPSPQVKALRLIGKPAVPALIDAAGSEDVNTASQAIQVLGMLGRDALPAAAALVKLLGDDRKGIRDGAGHALSLIAPRDAAVASAIVSAHARRPTYALRSAIGRIGKSAVPSLVEALDGSESAKGAAAQAIAEIGVDAAPAVDALGRILRNPKLDAYSGMRRAAEGALGAIGPAAAEEATRLIGHAAPNVRGSGVDALKIIGPGAGAAAPALRDLLRHADPGVRRSAAEGLSHVKLAAVVAAPELTSLLKDDAQVRQAALQALEGIGPGAKDAGASVIGLLADKSEWVREAAVRALGSIERDAERKLPFLRRVLGDRAAHVRYAALDMLSRMEADAEPAARELANLLTDKDERIRSDAAKALREIGSDDPRVLRKLAEAIGTNPGASKALTGKGELLKPLVPILAERLGYFRTDARINRLLLELGKDAEPATEALLRALVAEIDRPRRGSGDMFSSTSDGVLVAIGRPAVPGLLRLVRHKNRLVRYRALSALFAMKQNSVTAEAVSEILRLVEADDEATASVAIQLLGKIGPGASEAMPALLRATKRVGEYRPYWKHKYPTYRLAVKAHVALARITGDTAKHAEHLLAMMKAPGKVTGDADEFHDNMFRQRQVMADGLLSLGKSAWPFVLRALQDDERDVRYTTCMALTHKSRWPSPWHEPSATPEQRTTGIAMLPSETVEEWLSEPMRREMAMLVIPRLGPRAVPMLPKVIAMLDDADLRIGAASVVEELGPVAAGAPPALIRMLDSADSSYTATGALKALGKIGPAARPAIGAVMARADASNGEGIREEAIKTMTMLEPEARDVLPLLRRIALDENVYGKSYQWVAWEAIEKLGPGAASAVPEIIEFGRRNPRYTSAVAEALAGIGPGAAEAVDDLILVVQRRGSVYSDGSSHRSKACEALGSIGPEAARALPVLRWAAHDQSAVVRRAAREAIAAVTEGVSSPSVRSQEGHRR